MVFPTLKVFNSRFLLSKYSFDPNSRLVSFETLHLVVDV